MYLQEFFEGDTSVMGCGRCRGDAGTLDLDLRMAFQPIVDVDAREVYAYEALVRGPAGEPAGWVLERVTTETVYRFDQTCRVLAIATAAGLGMRTRLSINFIPNAVYEPASCIRLTLAAADRVGFPVDRLMFEMSESERIADPDHALAILAYYHRRGFVTAIDDFGAGYAGLNLLARFQPQVLKLDMALLRGIEADPARQAIVEAVVAMATKLGSRVLAEGVETRGEYDCLRTMGIGLYQGWLFARPALEALPEPDWAAIA